MDTFAAFPLTAYHRRMVWRASLRATPIIKSHYEKHIPTLWEYGVSLQVRSSFCSYMYEGAGERPRPSPRSGGSGYCCLIGVSIIVKSSRGCPFNGQLYGYSLCGNLNPRYISLQCLPVEHCGMVNMSMNFFVNRAGIEPALQEKRTLAVRLYTTGLPINKYLCRPANLAPV